MTYTYVISKKPAANDFKTLCRIIGELYPGYEKRDGKKYADGAENIRWEKGDLVIMAEFTADPAVLTVTSNEELTELEREYRFRDKLKHLREKSEKREQRERGHGITEFLRNVFSGDITRLKFMVIPGILYAGWAALCLLTLPYGLIWLVVPVLAMLYLGMIFGWMWLIPAGLAVNWSARFKSPFIIKIITAALPVLSTAYACVFFDFADYSDYIFEMLPVIPVSLPVIYMAALPYLAVDEIACRGLLYHTGKRPSKKAGVICWVLSFAVSAAVLGRFGSLMNDFYGESNAVGTMQLAADNRYEAAVRENAAEIYKDDLKAIAEYACEYKYTDWRECPDESLEGPWRRVFLSGIAEYDVKVYDSTVSICIYGLDMDVSA